MIVMKFGGSSVANRSQIEKVLDIVRRRREQDPLVVSSAHKGITDALIAAGQAAAAGEFEPEPAAIRRQREVLAELGCAPDLLDPLFDELRTLLRGLSLIRELSPRSLDHVASFGERMSVRAIADFFTRQGLRARAYDVWELGFVTDANFNEARPLPGWEQGCREAVAGLAADEVAIVTGFVGKNEQGEITTVGRNGSDLTASLIGTAIGAEEIQIWTDTDGVMTANPRVVDRARNIPYMHFDEAAELAYFGCRVLHPSTLLPAMSSKVPVRVLNTNQPEHRGTIIAQTAAEENAATSIAYKEQQSVLILRTAQVLEYASLISRVFQVLHEERVEVGMVSTSEINFSLTSADRERLEAAAARLERTVRDIEVEVRHGKLILAIVGQHLPRHTGVGARAMSALSDAGINIEMVNYSSDGISFTIMIDEADVDEVVSVLHATLFNETSFNET